MNKKPHSKPAPPPPQKPALAAPRHTHWGEVADWYDGLVGEEGSEYHREVIVPGLLRMLQKSATEPGDASKRQRSSYKAPPLGLKVLDLACGQGAVARKLAAAGCEVVGIDGAAALIEAARRREAPPLPPRPTAPAPIRYEIADATRLLGENGQLAAGLQPNSFDAVTLVLAVQNMTPLSPVWHACHTVLKPGGVLILVMMHPAFRVPRASDWLWEEATGSQARVVRQYLSSARIEIQTHPGLAAHGKSGGESTTPHFHRPLQAYINTLGNAGLLIDHLEEWPSHKSSQAGPRKAALDKARNEIPMFLAIRARKV